MNFWHKQTTIKSVRELKARYSQIRNDVLCSRSIWHFANVYRTNALTEARLRPTVLGQNQNQHRPPQSPGPEGGHNGVKGP